MKKLITAVFCIFAIAANAQSESNPILFQEAFFGFADGTSKGMNIGINLNYQQKDDLFTVRYTNLIHLQQVGTLLFIPIYKEMENIEEVGILYGKRNIESNSSFSYSAGIAHINRTKYNEVTNSYDNQTRIGIPFEVNFKWFNRNKERYRIYFLVPVGRPTAFCRSFGIKILGNVSKTSFVGLNISYGFGFHKYYK